jgi:hypothetical protein
MGNSMRWRAILLTAILSLSAGVPLAQAAEPKVYPTGKECVEAEQYMCVNTGHGWVVVPPSQGEIREGHDIEPVDPVLAERQKRSARTNWGGTPEHPIVMVDMDKIEFPDALPYLDNEVNRVRVPIRFVAEAMGAKVEWNAAARRVTITRDGTEIKLTIDDPTVLVNGTPIQIDAPPKIVQDRTMVPLRFISEAFGANVDWVGTEGPRPLDQSWGKYQVWIWMPWGYFGKYTIHERLYVHKWWFYRGEVDDR